MVVEPLGHKARPDDLHLEAQPEESPFADWHVAVLSSLATAHEDGPFLEFHV